MEFPRQEYWSGLPFPSPGIFPTQGSNAYLLCHLYRHACSLPAEPSGETILLITLFISSSTSKKAIPGSGLSSLASCLGLGLPNLATNYVTDSPDASWLNSAEHPAPLFLLIGAV